MIQILLGHRDLEETTIYLHLSQRHLERATASPLDSLRLKDRSLQGKIDAPATSRGGRSSPRCGEIRFIERSRKWITWKHVKVLLGHCALSVLPRSAVISMNAAAVDIAPSPTTRCQKSALPEVSGRCLRRRWLEKRRRELLPTPYVHVVFTLPRHLAPLVLQNKKFIYDLLFRHQCRETLLEVARDPQHLGAEIGFFSVLHTWSQKLETSPACPLRRSGWWTICRSNPLDQNHTEISSSPSECSALSFAASSTKPLKCAFHEGRLNFHGDLEFLAQPKIFAAWLRPLFHKDWVVYAKRPFGGPEHVLRYLGRYTHRVAISNHRLISFADGEITFRWRDSAHRNEQKLLSLSSR